MLQLATIDNHIQNHHIVLGEQHKHEDMCKVCLQQFPHTDNNTIKMTPIHTDLQKRLRTKK